MQVHADRVRIGAKPVGLLRQQGGERKCRIAAQQAMRRAHNVFSGAHVFQGHRAFAISAPGGIAQAMCVAAALRQQAGKLFEEWDVHRYVLP
jgi:hypothetical protein